MTKGYSDDQWRNIYQLARTVLEMPKDQRSLYLESHDTDPEITREVLELADELESPDEEAVDPAGTKIGRFEVLEYLGSGGAGQVFSARDPELGRIVAIKILHPEQSGQRAASDRFVREARTASTLNHPNIVTVHEIIRSESSLAIVMELLEGEPLRHRIGPPMDLAMLTRIGRQMAEALAAAHAAGVVHRDIKPENVMVLSDGRIKVLDFGLARLTIPGQEGSHQTLTTGLPAGTLRYMSPEHYQEQPITAKSDIFAFGLVLYELATGSHPFASRPALEVLHAIATEEIPPPSLVNQRIPPQLDALILGMLAKDPAARPDASRIAGTLAQLSPERSAPSLPAAGAQTSPSGQRRKWMAATAVLALAAAGVVAWKRTMRAPVPYKLEQLTTLVPENRATAAAISADGNWMAYANVDGVFLRVIESGATTLVNGPKHFIVDQLAWLPDGTGIVASGFDENTNAASIWLLSATGGAGRTLREEARVGVPSPDGTRIAFIAADYSWVSTMNLDGHDEKRVLTAKPQDTYLSVIWSVDSNYLLFQRSHSLGPTDRLDRNDALSFESAQAVSGQVVSTLPNVSVWSAVALDGRVLFTSGKDWGAVGDSVMWSVNFDSSTGKLGPEIKAFDTPANFSEMNCRYVTASRDGEKLLLLRQRANESIFVADFQRLPLQFSNFHRLTLDESGNYPHTWTPDSQSVIFESNRANPSYDLFKQSLSQRVPEAIVTTPKRLEVLPQVTPDGKSVLFAASATYGGPYQLMRVPIEGSAGQEVPTNGPLDEFRCSVGSQGRCVIRQKVGRSQFIYSELDPRRGIGRELVRTAWWPSMLADWDISPDGRLVALPNHDFRSARVRILRLDAQPQEEKETEVELPGLTRLSVVTWTSDGSGWFVSIDTTVGRRLYFYDLHGHLTSMGDISGWAVPSPDGKKVAFLNKLLNVNAWVMSRQ